MYKEEHIIDLDFLTKNGITDYSDGDMVVIEHVKESTVGVPIRLNMILFLFCKKGTLEGYTNGNLATMKQGDAAIFLPNSFMESSQISADFEGTIIGLSHNLMKRNVIFNKQVWSLMVYLSKHPVITLSQQRISNIKQYFDLVMNKINDNSDYYRKEIIQGLFQCIICETLADVYPTVKIEEDNLEMKQSDLIFKKFLELLTESQGRERSVKEYADKLCITPKYLSALSKSVSQKTALEWIHQFTMDSITRQLKYSEKTIKEISTEMNFPNLSFFGKFVKAHLGLSPTQYRKKLRS